MRSPATCTVRVRRAAVLAALVLLAAWPTCTAPIAAAAGSPPAPSQLQECGSGARTLSQPGARVYPETGNGGYTSVHSEVDLIYSAAANLFLTGNHVVLTDRATQCLSSFSLDFERSSSDRALGPQLEVQSVQVDGEPAAYRFVQPTYPGDPQGPEDLSPLAHEASQDVPVGGPANNPLPPACSPELRPMQSRNAGDGSQCPADKLVVTPASPIAEGASFTVTVYYTGRPGVHDDGDGSREGWFSSRDGSLVSGEPVGNEDWMPLNDFPAAKPTYTFHETVEAPGTALANGRLISAVSNAPDADFPAGSTTWTWESEAPVASYLVQSAIGSYTLAQHTGADGILYYEAQAASISASRSARNAKILSQQEAITDIESSFNGPFPFPADGSVVGTAKVDSGQEETQGMIAFNYGVAELPTLWHENMHQWWGDNVTEDGYAMTFFKEGLAEWMEAYVRRGLRHGEAGLAAAMVARFNHAYRSGARFWSIAPSHPFAYSLFDSASIYKRPAAAYEALFQILGRERFSAALQQIQREYGGATITEPQLEAVFQAHLPEPSAACQARLAMFFTQWFDTAYSPGSGYKPAITGPGLDGEDLYGAEGCEQPAAGLAQGGVTPPSAVPGSAS